MCVRALRINLCLAATQRSHAAALQAPATVITTSPPPRTRAHAHRMNAGDARARSCHVQRAPTVYPAMYPSCHSHHSRQVQVVTCTRSCARIRVCWFDWARAFTDWQTGFTWVERLFGGRESWGVLLKKTAAAQFVLNPPFILLLIVYSQLLEGARSKLSKMLSFTTFEPAASFPLYTGLYGASNGARNCNPADSMADTLSQSLAGNGHR